MYDTYEAGSFDLWMLEFVKRFQSDNANSLNAL